MRNAYNESERTAKTILSSFIDKCSRQGDDCNYKKLLENFIEDLLIACYQPEYPAAEFMLHCLAHMLVSVAPAACPPCALLPLPVHAVDGSPDMSGVLGSCMLTGCTRRHGQRLCVYFPGR